MLAGRVILITGANEGIGFATARLCAEQGARVVIHGRDADRAKAAATRLGRDTGHVAGDLADPATPARIVAEVVAAQGGIDGLVNNAAMLDRCTIESVSGDLFDRMMRVNTAAPLMLIKAALPHFSDRKSASIVNIGSVNALCGAPDLLVYSATKAALATITRNLGQALGGVVRINQINVGWTVTESEIRIQRAEGRPEDWQDRLPHSTRPSGALLTPQQVAEHALFWLSAKSAPVTGQVYEVEQYPVIGRIHVSERTPDA